MTWSVARVVGESAAWVSPWLPPGADHVNLDWLEFYVAGGTATIMRAVPRGDAAELVDDVLTELRSHHVTEATWGVHPGHAPGGVDEVLLGLGAKVDHRVDILALPLGQGAPDTGPAADAVTVRPVRTRADLAEYARTSALAWDHAPATEADIDRDYAALVPGSFTGYWDGTPAGLAGYTLAGETARMWGAGVIPAYRGRGVYRALVAARLADAAARGATLALVHAAPTSSPILRRLGFAAYGQQQVFTFRPADLGR